MVDEIKSDWVYSLLGRLEELDIREFTWSRALNKSLSVGSCCVLAVECEDLDKVPRLLYDWKKDLGKNSLRLGHFGVIDYHEGQIVKF